MTIRQVTPLSATRSDDEGRRIDKFKFRPQSALSVGTHIHTSPAAYGKMMSLIKPRMAVAYHFFNDFDTSASINDEDVWPLPATDKPQLPDPNLRVPNSKMIAGGRYDMKDVIQSTYDEINKKYGLNEKQD